MLRICFNIDSVCSTWAIVESLDDASREVRKYIEKNDIGSRVWTGGDVVDENGSFVAWISYNGRIWDPSTKYGHEAFERYLLRDTI